MDFNGQTGEEEKRRRGEREREEEEDEGGGGRGGGGLQSLRRRMKVTHFLKVGEMQGLVGRSGMSERVLSRKGDGTALSHYSHGATLTQHPHKDISVRVLYLLCHSHAIYTGETDYYLVYGSSTEHKITIKQLESF